MASVQEWQRLMDAAYWLHAVQKEEQSSLYPTNLSDNGLCKV